MLDKIILQGMRFYGYHGVYLEEKKDGQWFEVDVELFGDIKKGAITDNIKDTINYSEVYNLVKEIVEGMGKNLIECVAEDIATRILEVPKVKKTLVRVKKPDVPINGPLTYAAVEIVRCINNE